MATKKRSKRKRGVRRQRNRRKIRRLTEAQIKERIRKALQPRYRIVCYYRGFDPDIDARVAALAKRPISGSGSWLEVGLRDLEFDFETRKASALKAAARIKEARIRGLRVMLDSLEKA